MNTPKDVPMHVILDFDSTFVRVEGLDELARIVLADAPDRDERVAELARITTDGMEGRIGFGESLARRLEYVSPNRGQIAQLVEYLHTQVSPSIEAHRELMQTQPGQVWIVSGGFREWIVPVVAKFGIAPQQVLANEFVWQGEQAQGCDVDNPLAHDGGKVATIRALGLKGRVIMVGDGMTDYAVREAGAADMFISYEENVTRAGVSLRADECAKTFETVAQAAGWL